jgi:GT2 family glycosyltransferase
MPKYAINAANFSQGSSVCLVTVTYGQRSVYVLKALESAVAEGVRHAIVIDNGSFEPVGEALRERFGNWVTVERFDRNQGSAPAFKKGIKLACDSGCELVLLLDDDNVLAEGCLRELVDAWKDLSQQHGEDNCMVLGFRPHHRPSEGLGELNGFLGFHIKDVPKKMFRRLIGTRSEASPAEAEHFVQLPYAPYSGLLFQRHVVLRHGLPDERFVLYADDLEFTHRIVSSGGVVMLVERARVEEQEISWNSLNDERSFIERLVRQGADAAVFYSVRNRCFFEAHKRRHSRWARRLNKLCMQGLIGGLCLYHGKTQRWTLICRAINDGEEGRLGVSAYVGTQLA